MNETTDCPELDTVVRKIFIFCCFPFSYDGLGKSSLATWPQKPYGNNGLHHQHPQNNFKDCKNPRWVRFKKI